MTKVIAKIFPWLLLVPAVIPLILINNILYPFVAPKTLLFRGVAILALSLFSYLALSGQSFFWSRLRKWYTWIPGGLLFIAYVSSLLGISFYHSFWSVFDRGDGLITFTSAVVFFYGTLLFADTAFISRIFSLVSWVGGLISVYGILQWCQSSFEGFAQFLASIESYILINFDIHITLIAHATGRIGSTLGNAAFLAGFLGLAFFATLIVLPQYQGFWRKALYTVAGLDLIVIILTATRGTLLAFGIIGLCILVWLAVKSAGGVRRYSRIGVGALILIAILFFVFRSTLAYVPIAPIARIASISLTDETVSSRLFIWSHMLPEALKHPLLGVGAEHIEALFDRMYDPSQIIEQWFDRSHNAYLDYFVQYGILGLALYVMLIAGAFSRAWKLWHKGDRRGVLIFLALMVYAIQNFFVFDTASSFWLLLIFVAGLLVMSNETTKAPAPFRMPVFVPMVCGIVLLIPLWWVCVLPLRANVFLADGYRYHVYDIHRAVASFDAGLALNTYADLEYGYQAYEMYTGRQQNVLSGEERITAYRYALDILTKNYERYPYDARTATYLAHVLDSAPPEVPADEVFWREVLTRATELSPKRSQAWYILANISIKKADHLPPGALKTATYQEALAVIEKYASTVPLSAEPRYILANLYLTVGDSVSADRFAKAGLAVYKSDVDIARRASRYYVTVKDWKHATFFLEETVKETPNDYPLIYDLAHTRYLSGDVAGAKFLVEQLKVMKPGLVETDQAFMEALAQTP